MRKPDLLHFLFLLTVLLLPLSAGKSVSAAEPMRVEITGFSEQSGQIALTAGAFDQGGKPLAGLARDNFLATVNGTQVTISDVHAGTVSLQPTSVVLLVDVSGSMAGASIEQARSAMLQFVQALDANDRVAVIAFDSRVTQLQDFSTDREVLAAAIGGLTPLGDTDLYSAVIAASAKAQEGGTGRKLVVLLSDGVPTLAKEKRAASLTAAHDSGAGFVIVGLGSDLDRNYLGELSSTSGGRLLEAPTPASLQQTYKDLAATIRNQYSISLTLPPSVDRTVQGTLVLYLTYRGEQAQARRQLDPFSGATAPPFDFQVSGITAGARLQPGVTALAPVPAAGRNLVSVQYSLDDSLLLDATSAPFGFSLDTTSLSLGSHILRVVATDQQGARGESEVPFLVVGAASSSSSPLPKLLLGLLVTAALLAAAYFGARKFAARLPSPNPGGGSRVQSWVATASTSDDGPAPSDRLPAERSLSSMEREFIMSPAPVPQNSVVGRIVVMDEAAIRAGKLDAFREYPIGLAPLALGTGPSNDIQVQDSEGRIAMEEARLWIQKGRLVYHKLTTLSAMATEGVTSGWQILDSGEELLLGPFRLLYQALETEPEGPSSPGTHSSIEDASQRHLSDYARGA